MLIAIHKQSGEKVKAAKYATGHTIRSQFPLGELICPFCEEVVFARERKGFVLHFVHRHPCTSTIDRHPESPEHEQGKFEIAKFLQQQIKDDPNKCAKVEVEYRLPECGERCLNYGKNVSNHFTLSPLSMYPQLNARTPQPKCHHYW
jgi:competence protein CoiA